MIEPLRYYKETSFTFEVERPVFCTNCMIQKQTKNNPNLAIVHCQQCSCIVGDDQEDGAYLCKTCDADAHKHGLCLDHVRQVIVVGPSIRKKLLVRGDGVNFPMPLDSVTVDIKARVYHNGQRIHTEKKQTLSFMAGMSGKCIHVQILGARDLRGRDISGTSDPFVVYSYCGRPVASTRVKPRTRNPRWFNETFIVPVDEHMAQPRNILPSQKDLIKLEVFDHDWITQNDFLGHVEMSRSKLLKMAVIANEQPIRLPLTNKEFHGILSVQFAFDSTHFHVRVVSAEDLDKQDLFKYASPYAKVFIGEKNLLGSTPVIHNSIHPLWATGHEFKIKLSDLVEAEEFLESQLRMHRASAGISMSSNRRDRRVLGHEPSRAANEYNSTPDFLALVRIEVFDRRPWRGDQLLGKVTVFPEQLRRVLPDLPTQNELHMAQRAKDAAAPPPQQPISRLISGSFKSPSFKFSQRNLMASNASTPSGSPDHSKRGSLQTSPSKSKKSKKGKKSKKKISKKARRRRRGDEEEGQQSSDDSSSDDNSDEDSDSDSDGGDSEDDGSEEGSSEENEERGRDEQHGDGSSRRTDLQPGTSFKGRNLFGSGTLSQSVRGMVQGSFRAPLVGGSASFKGTGVASRGLQLTSLLTRSAPQHEELVWCVMQRYPLMKFSMKSYVANLGLGGAMGEKGCLIVRLIASNRGHVVAGLDEGVRRMTVGETSLIKCRYDAFYGSFAFGPSLPPRSNVTLQVRLLEVNGYGRLGAPTRVLRRVWRLLFGAVMLLLRLCSALFSKEAPPPRGKSKKGKGKGKSGKPKSHKAASRRWSAFSIFSPAQDEDEGSDFSEDEDGESFGFDDDDYDENDDGDDQPAALTTPSGRAVPLTPGQPDPFVRKHLNQKVVAGSRLMFDLGKTVARAVSIAPPKAFAEDDLTRQLRRLQELQEEEKQEREREEAGAGVITLAVVDHDHVEESEEPEEKEDEDDVLDASAGGYDENDAEEESDGENDDNDDDDDEEEDKEDED